VEYDAASRRYILRKGRDSSKDQSYFLFEMTQKQLARAVFPLGETTKAEVRDIARELGLETADKPESQEICFVPDGDYARFVEDYAQTEMNLKPGEHGQIALLDGSVVGEHSGLHRYTVGQRRRIGVAATDPLYVVKIDVPRNQLIVGNRDQLFARSFTVTGVNWIASDPPAGTLRSKVRIRYRAPEASATITAISESKTHIEFDEPQPAITPGQAAVFYDADVVVGGGWIE
jgi:tRNA-specific 2-thiouridylase